MDKHNMCVQLHVSVDSCAANKSLAPAEVLKVTPSGHHEKISAFPHSCLGYQGSPFVQRIQSCKPSIHHWTWHRIKTMHIVFIRNKLHIRSLLTYLHESVFVPDKILHINLKIQLVFQKHTNPTYSLHFYYFLLLWLQLPKNKKIILTSDNSLSYSSYKTNLANSLKQTCVSFFMLAVIWYFYVMLPF